MSYEDVFNRLCMFYYAEEARLLNNISSAEAFMRKSDFDIYAVVQLVQAKAEYHYFRTKVLELIKYISYFCD